jgi:hypothetical protein
MTRLAVSLLAAALATPALAHDFWLEAVASRAAPGEPVPFIIQIGHGDERERWRIRPERIVLLASFGPGGRADQRGALRPGDPVGDIAPAFDRRGVHVLALQTSPIASDLPADRFNAYAKEEGLTPILESRARAGHQERRGREIYSRRAKALIQVGDAAGGPDSAATRPTGLSLEIVPERDPFALGDDRRLPLRVLSDGRPLAGATVKLTNLEMQAGPLARTVTDAAGRAVFTLPEAGRMLLSVAWSKPLAGDPRGDFDTTFASLTFGHAPERP